MFPITTKTRRATALSALVLSASLVAAACSSDSTPDEPTPGSAAEVQTPGDAADVMFAQMMIPHHEQAVVMADLADGRASDPLITDLAREIKAAQDPEIALMDAWLQTWGVERLSADEALSAHGSHGMAGMLSDEQLDALADSQGAAFDTLFAQSMVEHHLGAVEMARDVLDTGSDPLVAALAREIIVTQEKEILTLQAFLGAGDAGSTATVPISPALGHVHGAIVDGDSVVAGTHDGVHRIDLTTGASERIGSSQDDFMGFTGQMDATLVASGHPGPGSPLPNPLGLIASTDGGETWESRSLTGEVDFHGLAVKGDEVVGWDTRGPIQWSTDGGRTWTPGPEVMPTALTWFRDVVWLASPDQGLVTWRPGDPDVRALDLPAVLVAASADGSVLWRVDSDGSVHRTEDGSAWSEIGLVTSIEAFAADTDQAIAVTGRGLQIITD